MSESERQRKAVEEALVAEEERAKRWEAARRRDAEAAQTAKRSRRARGAGDGKPADSPGGLIFGGVLLCLVGGAIIGFGYEEVLAIIVGGLVALAGQLMAMIGVVAAGVRLGSRWARYDDEVMRRGMG